MKNYSLKISIFLLFTTFCNQMNLIAQTKIKTLTELTSLRDNFISDIKSFRYSPSLPPPILSLDNPISFGNYDDTTNILHTTGDWQTLPQELKDFFNQAAEHADMLRGIFF